MGIERLGEYSASRFIELVERGEIKVFNLPDEVKELIDDPTVIKSSVLPIFNFGVRSEKKEDSSSKGPVLKPILAHKVRRIGFGYGENHQPDYLILTGDENSIKVKGEALFIGKFHAVEYRDSRGKRVVGYSKQPFFVFMKSKEGEGKKKPPLFFALYNQPKREKDKAIGESKGLISGNLS